MSTKSVKEFLDKIAQDESLRNELTNAVKRNADYERWIDDFLGGRQD